MRWVASLCALGLAMALFHHVTAGGPLEGRATLALGFLLLAAHLGGEIAHDVRLPRLTGYLVTGFCVGPAWLDLVRADEVEALGFLADGALALIAFAAGSELTREALQRGRVVLARLATGAIALPFVAVTLVVLSVSPAFPLTVHQPWGDRLAIALVLGTLAAASSPTITMAVISDLDARGPFARSLLGVTVIQEVAAALLFTIVVAGSKALTSAGALNVSAVGTAVVHLVGSLAVGTVLGSVLARYLQLAQWDSAPFLVAVAFVVAAIARLTGLETILVALAAGFYLENFSRIEGERLRGELKRGSRAAYVGFFALVGADLRLGALTDLWPWVLLLVGLRVVSVHYGLRWAGRDPAVTPALARFGWLGLISQAGMALGLAQLARRAFPEWGVSLERLLVAMIGVYEVVGPICFRLALVRAGEAWEGTHGGEEAVARGTGGATGGV
jgi:Kef-type K+ transport system membrane component KefB